MCALVSARSSYFCSSRAVGLIFGLLFLNNRSSSAVASYVLVGSANKVSVVHISIIFYDDVKKNLLIILPIF